MKKLIIIVGPTASGKSELAVKMAKKVGGEIISADSRQIYRGLNIGSGKVPGKWQGSVFMYKKIPHYTIDIADPKKQISVAQFQRLAHKAIKEIYSRGHIPIICGGTAHWVDAVVYDQKFPKVKPNLKLRQELEQKSVDQLFKQLKKLDPQRAKTIDPKNPRRLVRALEIILSTGKPVPQLIQKPKYDATWIGMKVDQADLYKKIDDRLQKRLSQGMLKEIQKLHDNGVSWKRLEDLGLEYKFGALYLQNKITKAEMLIQLSSAIKHYAKRQLTWWKRNEGIRWTDLT